MDHKTEFNNRAGDDASQLDLYLFGWTDGIGNGGDYGLNDGPAEKTFTTLITTTYMFQPEPKFTLHCRQFRMSADQFDYLQEYDQDTEDFLSTLGPLPDVICELDLSQYPDAASALQGMKDILPA